MRLALLILALALFGCVEIGHAKPKAKPQIDQAQKDAGFRDLFGEKFSEWDRDHDGMLEMGELNHVIESPQMQGNDSAIAVYFHRRLQLDKEDRTNGLTLTEVLAWADDPKIQKNISGKAWHIQAINHALFAPGDPNLETFHQGGIGDCYLLAVIGTFVYHHPQEVRNMIQLAANGRFTVKFATGKTVQVEPMTDAELIMGATEGRDHGVWLSVLEKAYAQIDEAALERKTGEEVAGDESVATDFIGHGGYANPVMILLSGHKLGHAPLNHWFKQNPQDGLEKAHTLLTKLSNEHRLMVLGTVGGNLTHGIVHGHCYGALGYNEASRKVIVFNPWGNHFKPSGPPGLTNGYPTQHGIFEVPLAEFVQIFGGVSYETDKPAASSH